jgi:two-component system sensor histidine kinase SenX3
MRFHIEGTRALQIGLLALLVICFGQTMWWILDEAHFTDRSIRRTIELLREQARAANRLVDEGADPREVLAHFPRLELDAATGKFRASPEHVERLRDERWHRLNRYGWEGGFFLVVLVAGMAILARAIRQDARLRRRQQNFLAAVSHEFKTPLASMRLSTETLALRDPPGERRRELLDRILADLGRIEVMVTNLLDSARLEEARLEYFPGRVPLEPVVRVSVEKVKETSIGRESSVEWNVEEDLEVYADPVAVQSVVHNLVDNALKATRERTDGRVVLRAVRDGRFARLEVEDNGVGFPPREAKRLFDKFYRLGNEMRRRTRGSGLGLYLAGRLVRMGGGKIWARSEGEGKGSVFVVTWPLPGKRDGE